MCAAALAVSAAARQTMLMNRLGPSQMLLYVANADGSGARPPFATSGFDYNASFSPDGKWIVVHFRAQHWARPISIACMWMARDWSV